MAALATASLTCLLSVLFKARDYYEQATGNKKGSDSIETLGVLNEDFQTSRGRLELTRSNTTFQSPNDRVWKLANPNFSAFAMVRTGDNLASTWEPRMGRSSSMTTSSVVQSFTKNQGREDWPWYLEKRIGITEPHIYVWMCGTDSKNQPLSKPIEKGNLARIRRRLGRNLISEVIGTLWSPKPICLIEFGVEVDQELSLQKLQIAQDWFIEIRSKLVGPLVHSNH